MSAFKNEWVKHDGNRQHIDDDKLVIVRFNDDQETKEPNKASIAGNLWLKSSWGPYITHYKLM